ncbi:hypothetical protein OUY22_26235 [Nonomuraea sp. MCN248]|uniref:Uncharacterized protein n=1 Tax=Nonomuraea corallina TaxID=2989783 RepID=A0ABT4SI79_9ACTN|nr:hypothetical protein [Nonomuraea corallina]MDA0636921.1 hypothetical protein [Nonomuraea corallina]
MALPPRSDGPQNDAVGARLRAFHDHGLARDAVALAAVADPYSFRELERFGRLHAEGFSLAELLMRLEFVEFVADEEFAACGVTRDRSREDPGVGRGVGGGHHDAAGRRRGRRVRRPRSARSRLRPRPSEGR